MIKIGNKRIQAAFTTQGASLTSLTLDGKDIVWLGDDKWWGRVAPFLFPIVGRLLDNSYTHQGERYALKQHGFLRDSECTLVEQSSNHCSFRLESNAQTKASYPFDFVLTVQYTLGEQDLAIDVTVENTGDQALLYSLGYHPAFILDRQDFEVELVGQKPFTEYFFDGPYCIDQKPYALDKADLSKIVAGNETLVYGGVEKVILRDGDRRLSLAMKDYPYVGIWQPVIEGEKAPFVCLEPWVGFGDWRDHNQVLADKFGISKLAVGAKKTWHMMLEL